MEKYHEGSHRCPRARHPDVRHFVRRPRRRRHLLQPVPGELELLGQWQLTLASKPDAICDRVRCGRPLRRPRRVLRPRKPHCRGSRAGVYGAMTEPSAPPASPATPDDPNAECPRCGKPPALCVCEGIAPIDNKISLLILQHPQEQDRELGTARLTALHFKDALLKIGLSWPSLTRILGRPADPQRWAILYLGSVRAAAVLPDRDIVVVSKNGVAVDHQAGALREIDGIILLDGTWSQAKALWWRNAWMLKCKRVVLGPKRPSRYGRLRREPRSDGLSTIEAAAMLLARLEGKPEIEATLNASFERLLVRYRATRPASAPPRPDFRRRRRRP